MENIPKMEMAKHMEEAYLKKIDSDEKDIFYFSLYSSWIISDIFLHGENTATLLQLLMKLQCRWKQWNERFYKTEIHHKILNTDKHCLSRHYTELCSKTASISFKTAQNLQSCSQISI